MTDGIFDRGIFDSGIFSLAQKDGDGPPMRGRRHRRIQWVEGKSDYAKAIEAINERAQRLLQAQQRAQETEEGGDTPDVVETAQEALEDVREIANAVLSDRALAPVTQAIASVEMLPANAPVELVTQEIELALAAVALIRARVQDEDDAVTALLFAA